MTDTAPKETVTITKAKYDRLVKNDLWLGYLEDAGVDNWQGFEEAVKLAREDGFFNEEDDGF